MFYQYCSNQWDQLTLLNSSALRSHNKIMSSGEEEGLRAMVLGWAKNNEERCARWLAELKDNDIEDMQALVKRATFESTWEKLMNRSEH